MTYEWNPAKAESNRRKHGIDFADAVGVFSDDLALTMPDERFEEERYITIGMDFLGRILVVVCTWRETKVRIISARLASRHERKEYEKG